MKECPKCGSTYSDNEQRFCLSDGAELIFAGEQETVESVKVIEKGSSTGVKIILGLVFALLLGTSIVLGVLYFTSDRDNSSRESKENTESSIGEGFQASNSAYEEKTYVNSPNDRFLALRSIPNHRTGRLIAKIPHGQQIDLTNCSSKRMRIGGKSGRWCKTTYDGKSGWVFDAWTVKK